MGWTAVVARMVVLLVLVVVDGRTLAAQYRTAGPSPAVVAPQWLGEPAGALDAGRELAEENHRLSRGWVRFTGGFVAATATLAGLIAATWDDPDAVPDPLVYGGYVAGTWLGTVVVTSVREKPNVGILLGAAIGALPLLAGMGIEDDGAAGAAMLAAWIGAPLGGAIGQRLRAPRPRS